MILLIRIFYGKKATRLWVNHVNVVIYLIIWSQICLISVLRNNYIHHGIAAVINNHLNSRAEFGAYAVVPGVGVAVPGAGRQAARVLHV